MSVPGEIVELSRHPSDADGHRRGSSAGPRLHVVNVVWGADFTRTFVDVSLPSQLSPGNLPKAQQITSCVYRLFTTRADAEAIRKSAGFARLCEVMPVEIIEIPLPTADEGYRALTAHQAAALREAASVGAAVMLLAPDVIVADGGLSRLAQWNADGKQVVMALALRVDKVSFVETLRTEWSSEEMMRRGIAAATIVGIALRHLHPISRSLVWPPKSTWPSHLYWLEDGQELVAHGFHLHPILVTPPPTEVHFNSTVDGDYVMRAFDTADVQIVDDSNDLAVFELSRTTHRAGKPARPQSESQVGRWAAVYTNSLHRRLFLRPVRFHQQNGNVLSTDLIRRAAEIVEQIRKSADRWLWIVAATRWSFPLIRPLVRCYRRLRDRISGPVSRLRRPS